MTIENLTPELAGHAAMCVRLKLRKDERDVARKDVPQSVRDRIERGKQTLAILNDLKESNDNNHTTVPPRTADR